MTSIFSLTHIFVAWKYRVPKKSPLPHTVWQKKRKRICLHNGRVQTNIICEFFTVVIPAVLLYIPTRCRVHLQRINCKTNNVLEQCRLLNLLKQVFLLYISLGLCNNGPSDTQREAAEHWGDIKSDFVPLGVPLVAWEFWWAVWCSARQRDPERAEREERMSFYFITNSTVRNRPARLQCLLHYSYSECWTAPLPLSHSFTPSLYLQTNLFPCVLLE